MRTAPKVFLKTHLLPLTMRCCVNEIKDWPQIISNIECRKGFKFKLPTIVHKLEFSHGLRRKRPITTVNHFGVLVTLHHIDKDKLVYYAQKLV